MIALLRPQFWHLFHLVDRLLFHWRLNNNSWWIKNAALGYLHCYSFSSLPFFMYLLSILSYLSIALTSSSPIRCSFKAPPSWFKMNIKKTVNICKKLLHRSFRNLDLCHNVYLILLQKRQLSQIVWRISSISALIFTAIVSTG